MNIVFITLIFIILDFLTGVIKSIYKKEFNSSIMRQGLFHKVGSIITVALGFLVDYAQRFINLDLALNISTCVCGYIILMEIGSIIENIGAINPEILPAKLRECFTKIE